MVMEGTVIKFRILEFLEDGPKRTEVIAKTLAPEFKGYDNQFGWDKIKYDCIELASAGLINEGEAVLDEEGIFKKGKLLITYSISGLGQTYLNELKTKVKPKKV